MTLSIVYAIVILIATTLGAFVGLGGGVIIKPVLDFIGKEPRLQVDFLSCVAVLTMSIFSTAKAIKRKQKFEKNIIFLVAGGSIVGGWLGSYIIGILGQHFEQNRIRFVQAVILAALLLFVALYTSFGKRSFHIKNGFAIVITGLVLGCSAAFLGIGGGPINVAVFMLLFSMEAKDSAVYSIAVIFFSQSTKLISVLYSNGISAYSHQWKTLLFILPAAILGGIIGAEFNKKSDNKTIKTVFSICMLLLVCLNVYNAVSYF